MTLVTRATGTVEPEVVKALAARGGPTQGSAPNRRRGRGLKAPAFKTGHHEGTLFIPAVDHTLNRLVNVPARYAWWRVFSRPSVAVLSVPRGVK